MESSQSAPDEGSARQSPEGSPRPADRRCKTEAVEGSPWRTTLPGNAPSRRGGIHGGSRRRERSRLQWISGSITCVDRGREPFLTSGTPRRRGPEAPSHRDPAHSADGVVPKRPGRGLGAAIAGGIAPASRPSVQNRGSRGVALEDDPPGECAEPPGRNPRRLPAAREIPTPVDWRIANMRRPRARGIPLSPAIQPNGAIHCRVTRAPHSGRVA